MLSFLRVPRSRIAAVLSFVSRVAGMGDMNTMLIEIQANLKTTLRRLGSVSEHALTPEHVSIEPEFSLLAPSSGYCDPLATGWSSSRRDARPSPTPRWGCGKP